MESQDEKCSLVSGRQEEQVMKAGGQKYPSICFSLSNISAAVLIPQ